MIRTQDGVSDSTFEGRTHGGHPGAVRLLAALATLAVVAQFYTGRVSAIGDAPIRIDSGVVTGGRPGHRSGGVQGHPVRGASGRGTAMA